MSEEIIMSTSSSTTNDKLFSRKCCGMKGLRLRLNSRRMRFSVHRLRTRFLFIFTLFRRWRNSYRNALRHLRRLTRKNCKRDRGTNDFGYTSYATSYGIRSMRHSNSFCAEAIADCLEFIKRNSVSLDDERNPILLIKQE